MKKFILFSIGLFFVSILSAQVLKMAISTGNYLSSNNSIKEYEIVEYPAPFQTIMKSAALSTGNAVLSQLSITKYVSAGGLFSAFTSEELATVTRLTLIGTIDARDFKTMRDNMPLLAEIDLSGVVIVAYNGPEGTTLWVNNNYMANEIPEYAFNYKMKLTSFVFPLSVTSIGQRAFSGCSGLSVVTLPVSVTQINGGFDDFSGLINVDKNSTAFSNLDDMLFNKDRTQLIKCPYSKIGTYSIPSTVTSIKHYAFEHCSFTSMTIPASVTLIENSAFMGSAGDKNVDENNPNYSSLNGVLYNKAKTLLIHCPTSKLGAFSIPETVNSTDFNSFYGCSGLTSIHIPSSVTSIGVQSFGGCSGLTSIEIPSSVTFIGGFTFTSCTGLSTFRFSPLVSSIERYTFQCCSGLKSITIPTTITSIGESAFIYCTGLNSVYVNSVIPIDLSNSPNVFEGVNKTTCSINVPIGLKAGYVAANQWKDFTNIVGMPGLFLSAITATIAAAQDSKVTIEVTSNVDWTAISDQTWLTVGFASGGSGTRPPTLPLTLTAAANTSASRTAKVTVSATGVEPQLITVTQVAGNTSISVTAGGLKALFTANELAIITKLTLTGTIDARDFKTMRDDMSLLKELDLSGVTIAAYTGTEGTVKGSKTYPANAVPEDAFYNSTTYQSKASLISVVLPQSLTAIGDYAFNLCLNLKSCAIPSSVTSIGDCAFSCCEGLTNISIPSSVVSIGRLAFNACLGLTLVNSYLLIPVDLSSVQDVFTKINETTCILNVPYGTKLLYAAANQWKDFVNIVERPGFKLSATTVNIAATQGSKATVDITSNVTWTASSDQAWLTVSPNSGTANQTLTFTVAANTSVSRTAKVTVSATGVEPQLITVTQAAGSASITVTAGGLKALFTANELSTITKLTLAGTIDARDFKTMRDDMPLLSEVDISGVTIAAYTGTEGTVKGSKTYPANAVPEDAFYYASVDYGKKLTCIQLPLNLVSIGDEAFEYCTKLSGTLTIPSSVTSIGEYAFWGCKYSSVFISSAVLLIGNGAFNGIINSITVDPLNPNYSSIDGVLFNKIQTIILQCPTSRLGNYTIPSSVATIGNGAFALCEGLTSIILPPSVQVVGFDAFEGCVGLSSVIIPSSVISIGGYSFSFCTGLTTLSIPSSVTSIGYDAFANCSGLTTLSIPSSVVSIGEYTFDGCTGLKSIDTYSLAPVDLTSGQGVFNDINKTTCILNVPYGTKLLYAAANQWKDFVNIVERPGFKLSATTVNIAAAQGSKATVDITSNVTWTASSDQAWLTVSPNSGTANQTLTFTAAASTSVSRTAKVTVSATGVSNQYIIVIQKLGTVVNWNNPADIVSGTALSGIQLNATANIAGTLTYTPAIGTILNVGNNQPLKVVFTPTDAANYETVTKTVYINVTKPTPEITWATPADIVYGTFLSSTQLNATADVPGNFVYKPGAGSLLSAGTAQSLYAEFVPTDFANYEITDKSIFIDVVPAFLLIAKSSVNIAAAANSRAAVDISTNLLWTASSNQAWLSVSPASSAPGNKSLIFIADENVGAIRTAVVTIRDSSNSLSDQTITVTQAKSTTAVGDDLKKVITVFPNPVTDAFQITGINETAAISLVDVKGRLLLTKEIVENESISMNSFTSGIYIVRIVTSNGVTEKKLVKK